MKGKINYLYSLVGGGIYFFLIALNTFVAGGVSPLPVKLVMLLNWYPVFLVGILQALAIIWLFNALPTKKFKIIAFVVGIVFVLPITFLGFVMGGLLGSIGVAVMTSIPIIVYVVSMWVILYKAEKVWIRAVVVIVVLISIQAFSVYYISKQIERAKVIHNNSSDYTDTPIIKF